MLQSQLVRNHLTGAQIKNAKVIYINRKEEAVLIQVAIHGAISSVVEWHMLSYATGHHSITTGGIDVCERVKSHWDGFVYNVSVENNYRNRQAVALKKGSIKRRVRNYDKAVISHCPAIVTILLKSINGYTLADTYNVRLNFSQAGLSYSTNKYNHIVNHPNK